MRKLEVRLVTAPGAERTVGHLAESERRMYFEYDRNFLEEPVWLSPFKLPPEAGLHEHRDYTFGPIFGLFDDSLPDGWGLLLMDRFLQQSGFILSDLSVLQRLAFLGTKTMGALTYHPPSDPSIRDSMVVDLHDLASASNEIVSGSTKEVLSELVRAGGSPGGARPKVLIGVCGDKIISGEDDLPNDYEHWLVKFGNQQDLMDAGLVEFAYSLMAKDAGIFMPRTRLFETSHDERFFGVERFDRRGNRRFHVHTFGNLIHSNFRVPSCDYEQLLRVTKVLTKNHEDVLQSYRRMVFNVLMHNRDDHVKNFAFMINEKDEWILAPAYDLIYARGPGSEHTMTIAGEGKQPRREHLLRIAEKADISVRVAEDIIDNIAATADSWVGYAKKVGMQNDNPTVRMIHKDIAASCSLVAR